MIAINCKNQDVAEHILYFLNSLPKKDVEITITEDDFYSSKEQKEILKRVNEIKTGKVKTLTHEQIFADIL